MWVQSNLSTFLFVPLLRYVFPLPLDLPVITKQNDTSLVLRSPSSYGNEMIVSFSSLCRFLSGTQTRHVFPRTTPTVSPFQVLRDTSSYFLLVMDSLLLLKHGSHRWFNCSPFFPKKGQDGSPTHTTQVTPM